MRKRIICVSVAIISIFCGISGRIGYIALGNDYKVSVGYNSYVIGIDSKQPTIFDRNYSPITNNKKKYALVIRPNAKCIGELSRIYSYKECQEIIEELKNGKPIILYTDKKRNLNYIKYYKIYSSYDNLYQLLDKNSNGIKNHIDNSVGTKKIKFSVDAKGRLLDGDIGEIISDNYDTNEGYRISIDKKIQNIVVTSTTQMVSGCVVVMNVQDASILAMINKPVENYSIKAFSNYSIGSVFKIVVALCALENNVDLTYYCTSKINVGDTTYSCQKSHIHGKQNLKEALANSCNCYFVNLANYIGKDKIYDTCEKLGLTNNTELLQNWSVKNANMPTLSDLSQKGELSLLGFGQGRITVTPLQIASALCTIGNYGKYQSPKLFISSIDDKNHESFYKYSSDNVVSSESCKTLLQYMRYVVSDGTGKNADTDLHLSAGKTATAQTGQYYNGNEKLNAWFAGVYPYNNPKYTIVVLCENGTSGSQNCCPIFRTIVEKIALL